MNPRLPIRAAHGSGLTARSWPTEAPIADWAILNALVNTASGAGTDLAAAKLERVLTNDPGMGVIRHVDAGYDRAVQVAERDVRIPMAMAEG